MATSRKTWISIIIAVVIIIGMVAAMVVGGTAYFIYHHVNAQFVPDKDAEREFATMRARFAGQQPLLEMRDDEPVLHRNPSAPRRELNTLHALAYDETAQKLVHVDIPMWILRLVPANHAIHISSDFDEITAQRARLTVEDLERHGPGLVLDAKGPSSGQVLVWTE